VCTSSATARLSHSCILGASLEGELRAGEGAGAAAVNFGFARITGSEDFRATGAYVGTGVDSGAGVSAGSSSFGAAGLAAASS
jgi:hypothetical protein